MNDEHCAPARQAIATRNLSGWRGLPERCAPGDLLPGLPASLSDLPRRYLGESYRPVTFALLTLEGYYRPMASFDGARLVLFDGALPELPDGAAPLLEALGAPEARLDWFYGTLAINAGEWVFPARGLTLFLNTAFDRALHIALYHPVALAEYQAELRPHLRKTLGRTSTAL